MTDDTKRTEATEAEAGQTGATTGGNTADPAASSPEAQIAALAGEVADLKDRLLRAHAEMDNIRKRSEREKTETLKYAVSKFAHDILTVGDNFQRAIDAVPAQAAEKDPVLKSFLDGVTMTERELLNVLERHGIRRMQAHNEPFNPHQHQAVMETHNAEVPSGTVVQVLQAGYMIEDRVLRPAMVIVAKGGPKPTAGDQVRAEGAAPAANDDAAPEPGADPGGPTSDGTG